MGRQNDELDRKLRSAQASITSLSIFVALSVVMMALVVSQQPVTFGFNSTVVSAGSLMFAIILFLIALEFFILCIYHCEHIDWFGLAGSCLYSFGLMSMIFGIALSMVVFEIRELSFMLLSIASIGYVVYYSLRWYKLKKEIYSTTRIVIRFLSFIILIIGFIFASNMGG